MSNKRIIGLLFVIFSIGLGLRLYGINWDQGYHLHPDERFLTMVETSLKLPLSVFQYLHTSTSPLNPYNYKDYQFFVYGTFPLFLVKYLSEIFHRVGYDQVYLVGRATSAIFDSLNIITLFFLSRLIFKKPRLQNLAPSLLYCFCVLPLQLSHFFTVDTFLNFFILLSFALLAYKKYPFAAVSFGFALACKISAVYFAPIFALFILFDFYKKKNLLKLVGISISSLLVSFLVFRFLQPYSFIGLFKINPLFIQNLKTLESFNDPNGWFPPAVQWMSKTKIIFPLQNIIFWGAGLPLSVLFFISLKHHKKNYILIFSLLWVVLLLVAQGAQFSHTMRYFVPIYPFICLFAAQEIKLRPLIVLHLIFGAAFLSLYSHPHSRVQASEWIYQNIPARSSITYEYWDDPLPLNLPDHYSSQYTGIQLAPYDPDSPEKMDVLDNSVSRANYLIMSSNRLWASIPAVPHKYPLTTKWYQSLFDGTNGYKKIIEINSYPGFSLPFLKSCYYFGPTNFPYSQKTNSWFGVDPSCNYPGIYLRDDVAEEAFTVYDHPKVLIFSR